MARSRAMRVPGVVISRLHGTAVGLTVLGLLVVIDLPTDWVLAGSYVVAPLITAVLSRPSRTAIVAAITVAATTLSLWFDHTPTSTLHGGVIRIVVSVCVGAIAVLASAVRVSREQALLRMTRIADVAQRALLPQVPAVAGDLLLATRYVSATSEALIGGDLYDLAETPFGTRLLIGDARGKGVDAVQRMVTVLGAFRASADRFDRLVDVARHLDLVLSQVVGDEDFVTALLVEYRGGDITVVNCGHHPPFAIGPLGMRFLDDAVPALPLGMGSDPESASYRFDNGRLLLYTDGLVEARSRRGGEFFSLDEHGSVLLSGDVDAALESLVSRLIRHTGGRVNDDIALLLADRTGAMS